ncbi:small ribosomal subunit biogenesis GTPase RsgA [Thorsellia anophelis]|uniref:Small ribosomal subunit biogenesis GTPase RsgA n=1 Tax=Thorsellia anophelis DSM 18579 TaxID=1123402 RepID=A0A1H9Y4J2_9GAMM|nr:small ribosomal subunit biogenesis GTPase RsgA [Thorsellia anophelis]SES63797.1 ribosome biogenesis GTPase [Thorsellia anophelis DSM 18579]
MSKKKLSISQRRRVADNQKKRLDSANHSSVLEDAQFGDPVEGIVISRFGKQADVESPSGQIFRCHIRRTLPAIVTGDHVVWRPSQNIAVHATGIIEALHPRRSLLSRPDIYDGLKPVAANIDQVFIVCSPIPALSLNVIDRYLISCEAMHLEPIILLNKIDLIEDQQLSEYETMLSIYTKIGYKVIYASSHTEEGLSTIKPLLNDKVTIFAGQSGVGKSSILNALLPDLDNPILVNEVSDISGLGQHTTTSSRLYRLEGNGSVIDSPGIREFGLWHLTRETITQGFIEFHDYLGGCKFRDCKHLDDPGCLITEAVNSGKISEIRFENYHRILESAKDAQNRRFMTTDDE